VKLATLRTGGTTIAVRVDALAAVEISGYPDVGTLLTQPRWKAIASTAVGNSHSLAGIDPKSWAAVVPAPGKILCAGLNYRSHILEMGRELPAYPTLFAKFPEALIGPNDDIELPSVSKEVDWEGELAVIIGETARRISEDEAASVIAGYAIINDVTMRDFQYRTLQWLQGKTFENSSPFGPFLVTPDEWLPGPSVRTRVDDDLVQEASTSDLVFSPAAMIAYISQILTLNPGDVIATGTPGGVGHAHKPPRYLVAGSRLETEIHGLGSQRNTARVGS
jgi:acylpyruvate hydrolase